MKHTSRDAKRRLPFRNSQGRMHHTREGKLAGVQTVLSRSARWSLESVFRGDFAVSWSWIVRSIRWLIQNIGFSCAPLHVSVDRQKLMSSRVPGHKKIIHMSKYREVRRLDEWTHWVLSYLFLQGTVIVSARFLWTKYIFCPRDPTSGVWFVNLISGYTLRLINVTI